MSGLASHALLRPLSRSVPASLLTTPALRHKSLSAVHRGLRSTERAPFGGGRSRASSGTPGRDAKSWESRGAVKSKFGRDDALTEKALAGARDPRARARLIKKLTKKAEEDAAKEDGPQSRRKRFHDGGADFGKKSLVYQLKHGALRDLADKTKLDEPVQARSFRSIKRDEVAEKIKRREERRQDGGEGGMPRREDKRTSPEASMREGRVGSRREAADRPTQTSGRTERARAERDGRAAGRGEREDARRPLTDPEKAKRGGFMPMTIKYTTSASQFLYGRSVVQAALSASRRNLYHLYLYAGSKGGDMEPIRRLAQSKRIPTTVVPVSDQRLMDKMSAGRPHNGLVLETSPLPQKPVVSLGPTTTEGDEPGFQVVLDHQSKEEEAVNGSSTFVPRATSTTPNPLVLVLHEILDPGNLGALIRTASYLGIDAVGITSRASSTLTPVVLKSAAGAAEEVTIFTIDSPVDFVKSSKAAGWTTYAAVAPPQKRLQRLHSSKFISSDAVEFTRPLAEGPCMLILGNEGYGLPKDIKVAADREISVPRFVQGSSVDSLNVSVAAALLCHSFVKGFDGPAVKLEREVAAAAQRVSVEKAAAEVSEEDEGNKMW